MIGLTKVTICRKKDAAAAAADHSRLTFAALQLTLLPRKLCRRVYPSSADLSRTTLIVALFYLNCDETLILESGEAWEVWLSDDKSVTMLQSL